jgi:hypothetical protein
MEKHVLSAAIIWRDESVTLLSIEQLDLAYRHFAGQERRRRGTAMLHRHDLSRTYAQRGTVGASRKKCDRANAMPLDNAAG